MRDRLLEEVQFLDEICNHEETVVIGLHDEFELEVMVHPLEQVVRLAFVHVLLHVQLHQVTVHLLFQCNCTACHIGLFADEEEHQDLLTRLVA